MATVTLKQPEPPAPTIVLELAPEEAQYVYDALRFAMPTEDSAYAPEGGDPVWESLGDALVGAGLSTSTGFARRIQ